MMKPAGHIAVALFGFLAGVADAHADAGAVDDGRLVSGMVRQALERGLSVPGARIDSARVDSAGDRAGDCRATSAELLRPLEGSGRVAVKVSGRSARGVSCDAWTWVRVRVVAPVAVAARALVAGDRLDGGATVTEERELRAGHAPAPIGPASIAARAVGAGQVLEAALVTEPTLRPGETVKVVIVSGALVIEQAGRGASCGRGRNCATLASGKLVEGDLVAGKLLVQAQ